MRSKITFFSLLAVLFFIPKVSGQCTTGGLYPNTSFTPACSGVQETINTDCWAGEYAEVNVVANKQYTFASSTATDYITITDAAGTLVYANGISPVTWSSGAMSGVIHYFIHKNSGCTTENVGRIRFITCATPVVTCTSPTGLFVNNITSNSARVNWTAPASVPSIGYDYYINTTNVAPVGATTATGTVGNALIATTISGMSAGTTYYYWIRSNCNSTKGNWVSGGNFATIAFQNCNSASYGLYPDATYTPLNTGSLEQIVTDTWAGEYTNVNITANRQYTFTSSVSTDYITITNATGTVVYATGTTPLVWSSGATAGVIRYYMHANSACADDSMGRVRYITSVISTCTAPNTIFTSGISSTGVIVTWGAVGTPSNGYDYIVTASNATPTNAATPTGSTTNTVTTATVSSGLMPNTTYYTWVRSNCGATKSSWFGPFLFVTLPATSGNGCTSGALYPSATFSPSCSGSPELITNVAYGGEYSNVSVANGRRLTFTSSVATDFITITNTAGTQILAYGITPVVYNVESGSTTLRYYLHTGADCGTDSIGRDRYITCSTTVCPAPASPVSSTVTSSGALLSWTPTTSPGLGYEYYINTSNVLSPQYNTLATGTSATTSKTISNLNASTTYYFWVRSACTASSKSNWIYGGSFTTLASTTCNTPTNLSVSYITSNSAILNFTEAVPSPASAYDYYLNTVNVAPTAATTPTGNVNPGLANITGLNASQTYFYWIRSNCGGTSQSAWVAGGSFTTVVALSCNGTDGDFGLYPDVTFTPACNDSAEIISTGSWAGEFCNVNITSGKYYTFTSSISTDYITITNATGNVVYASGITPVVWNSYNNSGVIRYFIHSNASCGTEQVSRTRSITCTPSVVSIVGTAASGWDTDVNLSSTDGVIYTLNNYTLTTGELKFRLNGAWNTNWGSTTFPSGTGVQNGPNIPVVACNYNITFNIITGAYIFVSTSSQPTAPTGAASQAFCNAATVANLVATGSNIKWYDASVGGNLLASNTALVSGTTYYASQSNGTCESVGRRAVTATINVTALPTVPPGTQTFCLGSIVGNLVATGTSKKWYTVPVNGSSLPPAALLATGTYYVTQTLNTCESARVPVNVVVNPLTAPTFTAVAPICSGATLTALPTTSNNAITGTWSPVLNNTATTTYTFTPGSGQCASTATMTITVNQKVTPTFTQVAAICSGATLSALPVDSINGINGSWSPALNNTATTTYTFTPSVGQCANTTTMTITVNQPTTPTFTQVAAICSGTTLTALPTTSNNAITGTWSPALNNTATTTYNFTPSVGQCANTATMTITVNQKVTPTFTQVATICSGSALSALPTTSNNGFTGTWSPALNNTATTTYTFTPSVGQCANTATMTITVTQKVTPTFTPVAAICSGTTLSALPTTSNNGFTGTWSPALNNTATTTYTFTPSVGQCANTATMSITVNQKVTPTFTQVATICSGSALSALPTTSNNGFTGTWSPALNNTATTTYTFTPSVGQCANTTTMTITVNQPVTPTFVQVAPICSGAALTALPVDSVNGINGSWSPALNNTATTTYTFTPSVGQCANTTTMTITVNQNVGPTFTAVAPICSGTTLTALPTTSNNGITGTWSPALNNTATTTYTFTPSVGQCANTATMTITVNQKVTPTFTQVAAICSGAALSALPTTSGNGFTGTWSPALNNTATTTYTFTPSVGQCANTATMTITVNQPIAPTFTQAAAICSGATLAALPTTSNNGITGAWSPALNNTATTTYTFTPSVGQCANTTTMAITVNQPTAPTFTQVAAICSGATLAALPTTSNNGVTGTWSPALNNTATTTYTFTPSVGQCANTATMTITVNQPTVPTFAQVAAICSGATLAALPTTSNNGITGTWSPALNNTATTTYTFTPSVGQCENTATMTITVTQPTAPTFTQVAAICSGTTLAALATTSNNGVTGTWSPALNNTATTTYTFTPSVGQCANTATMTITVNQPTAPTFTQAAAICPGATLAALPTTSNNGITGTWSPALNNTATTTYTFTPSVGQCANIATMTITVNQNEVPTFTAVAPICSGATLAALPTTSNNGIIGSWLPALDNTATTTYTFTPNAGQCALTTAMTITVNQIVNPTFTAVAPICSGTTLAALAMTSNNGITGTWSPALNNTVTTTYTFTPSVGQCATTAVMTITVNQPTTPTFTQLAPICSGAALAALPTTSGNGITGTWSPALDNTATTTYTFTPDAGQCALGTTMSITVNPNVLPAFAQVAPICSGATLSALPTTSNNGITGTWSPALDNTATTTYTFTPDAGLCALITTMSITVNPNVTPTFTQVAAICSGAALASLPMVSNNGITGTWSPALDNTATTTYTFTPDAGQCALIATMSITVNPNVLPTFTQVAPICSGETLAALPVASDNGITGTWSPALDNTATTTYTFTPDAGQCALGTTMSITVNPIITPMFTQVAPICSGETLASLPATSNNGITGTWSPALDNTATTTYTFTPDAGQCAVVVTMSITVNPIVTPMFTQVAAICSGETLASLPTVSDNGITGTWSPALDNTATTTYTFTPDAGQCALGATMSITVNPIVTPAFTQVAAICSGAALAALPTISDNGITGTWSPALNNTTTTTYTFTPDAGQCAVNAAMSITVNPNPALDAKTDITACVSYTLPALTNGNYFTQTGGSGTMLNAGDLITASQIVYVYADNGLCTSEISFNVTISSVAVIDDLADVVACGSYALPILTTNANYYTEAAGAGTMLNAGDVITSSQTIYIYVLGAVSICTAESDFTVTINPIPAVDNLSDVAVCDSYTLPILTDGNYYTEAAAAGTMLNAGDVVTSSQTIYIYATNGDCSAESDFTVTITVTPTVDDLSDVAACDSYTLPVLTNGNYYTETAGAGSMLNAGDMITSSQTIYIYASNGDCAAESDFTVTITVTPIVDDLSDVAACDSYTLPVLTNGNYYTEAAGAGSMLNAGDVITSSQTIYIYASNGDCAAESDFTVTITTTPTVDDISDVTVCDSYMLPALTNGNYFTEPAGAGTMLNAGDIITSSQIIYVYASNGDCSAETDFSLTINATPTLDFISDVTACDNYTLPALTNGNYFTEPAGAGTMLNAGDVITSSQTIYVYASNGDCIAETDFTVTITVTPIVDNVSDVAVCDNYILPVLTNGNYFTEPAGAGTMLNAGDVITSSQTIYVYASNGDCAAESDFVVTITTPIVDGLDDVVLNCVAYMLPVLTNGNYYTEPAGAGTMLNGGDFITTSQTIYIYASNGDCSAESNFNVTINILDNSTTLNLETITANQTGASYQWISCDETPGVIDGETNQSFTATANGQYAVVVTMGDCSITSECVTIDTLGKDDISIENLITMYPNPSRGNFTVDTGDIVADSIFVIDNLGRLIVEHKPTSQKSLMDVSSYEDGVYYIRIRYQNKETVKKLILQRN